MQKFSDVVSKVLYESLVKTKGHELATLILNWRSIAGYNYFSKTYPYKIIVCSDYLSNKKSRCLIIFAENQVVSSQIMYARDLLIEKINLCLGYVALGGIKIQVKNHFFQDV